MFWFITLAACSNTSDNKDPGGSASADRCAVEGGRPASWTEDTHGADAAPAYETVLDAGRVHALNITVDPEDYAFMYTELTELTHKLSLQIDGLTREIHEQVTARGAQPGTPR